MIQRIQSVYLLLTTLLSVLFLKGGFLAFAEKSGSVIKLTFSGIVRETSVQDQLQFTGNLPLTILIILIPVLAVIATFLFKKRNIQLKLVKGLILAIILFVIALGISGWIIITKYNAELVPGLKMFIPALQLIFAVLAYRGIKRDDDLVKSYDRLR